MIDNSSPIELEITPGGNNGGSRMSLRTFSSYSFDRNMLVPASPFRFTADGVDRDLRKALSSGDTVELYVKNDAGDSIQIATGFTDEKDTHITPQHAALVLTGRDTMGALVDNSAIDKSNRIVHVAQISLPQVAELLRSGTRIPGPIINQNCPNGSLLFQTNPGETKINALQRYLEYTNCLLWSVPNGRIAVGKPNMTQRPSGYLQISYTDPGGNNCLEARVRRNTNQAIKQIAVQIQSLAVTDPAPATLLNTDPDVVGSQGGRSLYRLFSQGNGMDAVNQVQFVGKSAVPQQIGYALARREIAMANMQVLDVEAVVRGHVNSLGLAYNVDQTYSCFFEDDDVEEDLYVYHANYELSLQLGRITRLHLCRLGTIVADVPARAT